MFVSHLYCGFWEVLYLILLYFLIELKKKNKFSLKHYSFCNCDFSCIIYNAKWIKCQCKGEKFVNPKNPFEAYIYMWFSFIFMLDCNCERGIYCLVYAEDSIEEAEGRSIYPQDLRSITIALDWNVKRFYTLHLILWCEHVTVGCEISPFKDTLSPEHFSSLFLPFEDEFVNKTNFRWII